MNTSRRNFIKNTSMVIAGAALLSKSDDLFASSPKKIVRVGVQLYSVRDAMHTNPKGS